MRVIALTRSQLGMHLNLLIEVFRLRRRVFKERLDWDVSVSGDLEIDPFDALDPTYLVLTTNGRDAIGSVRFLPTTGPTMLARTFPMLLAEQPPPHCDRIIESSRFCVDTALAGELADSGLRRATFVLFAGMIEHAIAAGATSIVTVTDTRMERVLRRAGWPLERIGPAIRIGNTMALAGFLNPSSQAREDMYRQAGVDGPVLTVTPSPSVAA